MRYCARRTRCYNNFMNIEHSEAMRDLLLTRYDATITENQIQISPEQLQSYVLEMAQRLAEEQTREEPPVESYETTYRNVFPPLYESEDFHELVERTAKFLGRSVVIIDLGFHVIDYSREIRVTDPLWTENVRRGYCTYEFIKAINEMLPNDRLPKNSDAFFITCEKSDELKLCSLLYYKKHPIGYMILLDNGKGIQPYHQQFLPRISKKLAKALRAHEEYSDLFISASSEILTNLLNGTTIEDGEALLLSQTLQTPQPLKLYILRGKLDTIHGVSHLRSQMHDYPQLLHVLVYHSYIVAFIKAEDEMPLWEQFRKSELKEEISDIASSNVFYHIDEIPRQYKLARTSFSLAAKLGRKELIHHWKDYEFFHILNECPDREKLTSYVHPAIYTLIQYDEAKDGQLLDTLKSYIQCGLSVKDTASALYVHRNTLTYRLKKITDLTGINLENISELMRLVRSVQILEFLG